MMDEDTDTMQARVEHAQALAIQGDRDGARARYADLWAEATHAADHYWACVIAHLMAAIQPAPDAQLEWHRRALQAAEAAGDARVHAFYPSLHANLADCYLRLGYYPQARHHLAQAQAATDALPADDTYNIMLGAWIARLAQALAGDRASGGSGA